jgi:predicted short-subunit dehydrogenase-like oxidoreductase (DUF2520 family)
MELVIVGAGHAGGSLALASASAGHRVVGVLARRSQSFGPALPWDEPLPASDLVLVAVSDAAIGPVAARIAQLWSASAPAVHLSGFVSVDELGPIAATGVAVGCFHPLQTLPDAERGAAALGGAWAAVTTEDGWLGALLTDYATSLGMRSFALADTDKGVYHAAAAAGANYVVEALAVAADLLAAAGVDLEVMEPLTRRVVENVFSIGPTAALTGPIARGDLATVAGQMAAADAVDPGLGRQFRLLATATAERVGLEL